MLIVVGGKTNVVGENLPLEVYDTDTSKWDRFLDIPKFRNSVIPYESGLLMYGGFEPENPNIPTNKFLFINFTQIFENFEYLLKNSDFSNISTSKDIIQTSNTQNSTFIGQVLSERIPSPNKKQIRLGLLAVIATIPGPYDNLKDIMKKIPIQNLQEESKKMHPNNSPKKTFTDFKLSYKEELAYYFLNMLKEPKIANIKFVNPAKDMLINLLDEIQKIFQSEPTLLELRSPLKIFGNLNGQYEDLFKIFEHFGYPNESFGDIEGIDYLFLGDYVDRGNKSLELICFLFALKLKYPEQINLLRGHHEDKIVNSVLGFEEECAEKLVEDTKNPNSIFQRINRVFEYMPLAAVIENKLLCVHGGIGQNVKKLEDIAKITKPIEILHDFTDLKSTPEQIIVNELLWTDPVSNNEEDDKINKRGFFGNEEIRCRKFSLERTKDFLDLNKLSMIIRSHEFIKDGYQNFNQKIITIVSCLDYCGELKNAGGIIYIRKNFVISPKIIIPERIVGQKEKKWFVIKEKSSGTQENNKIRQFVSPLRR